jgi:hypothetical protein
MQQWVPIALCSINGLAAWVPLFIIQFSIFMWWIMNGAFYAKPKIWVAFLVLYAHAEELFINWGLSRAFPHPRPQCGMIYDPWFENQRRFGFPSLETQLVFSLCVTSIMHFLLTDDRPALYVVFAFIFLPATVVLALWVTDNATFWQIAMGAIVGTVNAIRRSIVFETFLYDGLRILARRYSVVAFFISKD